MRARKNFDLNTFAFNGHTLRNGKDTSKLGMKFIPSTGAGVHVVDGKFAHPGGGSGRFLT